MIRTVLLSTEAWSIAVGVGVEVMPALSTSWAEPASLLLIMVALPFPPSLLIGSRQTWTRGQMKSRYLQCISSLSRWNIQGCTACDLVK